MAVDHRHALVRVQLGQGVGAGRHHHIATQHQPGIAGRQSHRMDGLGIVGDAHMGDHCPELLG